MKYQIFLGCTIPARQINYEESTRKVSEILGIQLVNTEFGCCGFPIEPIDETKALSMAAMNLKVASETQEPIVTLCSACGEMLSKAEKLLEEENITKEVNKILQKKLETSYEGEKPKVVHFARMLYEDYGIAKLKEKIVNPLKEVKIATHPGCHYVRPKELFQEFDDPEFPESLDKLVEATGAESVQYIGKTDCCGGGLLAVNEGIAKAMTAKKLNTLNGVVDAIVLICPFCSIMYDKYQRLLAQELEKNYDIPVLYYPQLLGLALGIDPEELGFDVNSVPVNKFLEKVMK
jgi:heterodisulfide reductase subunit B